MKRVTHLFFATVVFTLTIQTSDCFADRIFEGSIADIPQADDGVAEYYYDADTGQVIMSIGRGITNHGLVGGNKMNSDMWNLSQLVVPDEYPAPLQSDSSGIVWVIDHTTPLSSGIFNLGNLLDADSGVVDGISFDERFGAPNGRFSFPGHLEDIPFNVIPPETPTATPQPCIHTPPPIRPLPPVLEPPVVVEQPLPVPPNISVAQDETLALYYNNATGDVIASLGEGIAVIGIQDTDGTRGSLEVGNVSAGSSLGFADQADSSGIAWLDYGLLPSGVFNLGMLLEANEQISNTDEFEMIFGNLIGRSGVIGKPEKRTRFEVINYLAETTTASINSSLSVEEIELADPSIAQAYYDPDTGEVVLSIGESVFEVTLSETSSLFLENISAESDLGDSLTGKANEITWLDFTGLTSGIYNIGRLLPQGMFDQQEFNSRFGELALNFSTLDGQNQTLPIQILRSSAAAIPEPASFALFGLSGTSILTLRRRRRGTRY